ncbi:DUF421 domain-containing protein [Corynebacterium sp. ES2794-CONJ1]|nr:DUF421 domain-containing protein [Corynebacterium sp. ES2715-CONJ3]MCS4531569.1 DUF421 domain-containing protein [Corynebacterium sp. ES2730-CONJ]MCU9518965.1 DUF421 domain-containing protein [Corynebacterium sp. ES2794-CONJ1]
MYEQLTIDPWRIPVVILSGIFTYLGFIVLVRIFGARVLSKMHTFDAVVIVMFGAVAGRAVIGHPPTLMAGIVGLGTLMVMESIFGMIRDGRYIKRVINSHPQVIVANGEMIDDQLRKTHVSPSDIRSALRRAGIPTLSMVQLMILEPTGDLTVFKVGIPVDPDLLKGVAGVEYLYP